MQIKQCPDCKAEVAIKCRKCPMCGYTFYKRKEKKEVDTSYREHEKFTSVLASYNDRIGKSNLEELLVTLNKKLDEVLKLSNNKIGFSTERYLKRIDEKLTTLLSQAPKKTWVGPGIITDLTGWDREGLRKARRNNVIETRSKDNRIEYYLESLPKVFIKNTVLSNS